MPDKTDKVDENDCGIIDIMNARSCYPMGKRMAENLCFNYFYQYGLPVKIARLAQTFGAGILETDNRVFAQFARSVINKKNIVLHTDGSSIGNYCYSADAILGLILILLNGTNGQAYNVVNEESTMTIRQMAELVATRVAGGQLQLSMRFLKPIYTGMPYPAKTSYHQINCVRSAGYQCMVWRICI